MDPGFSICHGQPASKRPLAHGASEGVAFMFLTTSTQFVIYCTTWRARGRPLKKKHMKLKLCGLHGPGFWPRGMKPAPKSLEVDELK